MENSGEGNSNYRPNSIEETQELPIISPAETYDRVNSATQEPTLTRRDFLKEKAKEVGQAAIAVGAGVAAYKSITEGPGLIKKIASESTHGLHSSAQAIENKIDRGFMKLEGEFHPDVTLIHNGTLTIDPRVNMRLYPEVIDQGDVRTPNVAPKEEISKVYNGAGEAFDFHNIEKLNISQGEVVVGASVKDELGNTDDEHSRLWLKLNTDKGPVYISLSKQTQFGNFVNLNGTKDFQRITGKTEQGFTFEGQDSPISGNSLDIEYIHSDPTPPTQ